MNSLNFTPFILLIKLLVLPLFFLSADSSRLEDLGKRLSLYPPTEADYLPIIQAIDEQMSAIRQKNYDTAYFAYASRDFKRTTSLHQFTLFVKANPVVLNNKSLSLLSVRIDKNIAYYDGIAVSTEGDSRRIAYELIFEDDTWKILGIQVNPL